jgi:hypothetical protein
MAIPTTRAEFGAFCKRRLGEPVIEINVADEQVDDCIDVALTTFWDFHFEGTEKTYYKHVIVANNYPDKIYGLTIENGGIGYSNSDPLVFSNGGGSAANGTITTNGNGYITSVHFTDNGDHYGTPPTVTIPSSGGQFANVVAELGGFVPLPPEITGVINLFDVGIAESSVSSIFNIRYQIALNDIYQLSNLWVPDYYIVRQNIALIEEVLVGKQPIRFNKYKDRCEIDMAWDAVAAGTYLILEAYRRIHPDNFSEVWSDRWLQRYTTCLVKEQWGNNLKKYGMVPMVGGIIFNGQQIYNEALEEKLRLEEELIKTWSLPIPGLVG